MGDSTAAVYVLYSYPLFLRTSESPSILGGISVSTVSLTFCWMYWYVILPHLGDTAYIVTTALPHVTFTNVTRPSFRKAQAVASGRLGLLPVSPGWFESNTRVTGVLGRSASPLN